MVVLELLLEQTAEEDVQRRMEGVDEDEPAAEHIAAHGELFGKAAYDDQSYNQQLDVIKFEYPGFIIRFHNIPQNISLILNSD